MYIEYSITTITATNMESNSRKTSAFGERHLFSRKRGFFSEEIENFLEKNLPEF